jgi:hypothetical protein
MDDRHFGYKQKSLNKTPINSIGKRQGRRGHLSRANHLENMFLYIREPVVVTTAKIHLQNVCPKLQKCQQSFELDTSSFVSCFKPVLVSYYLSRLLFQFFNILSSPADKNHHFRFWLVEESQPEYEFISKNRTHKKPDLWTNSWLKLKLWRGYISYKFANILGTEN